MSEELQGTHESFYRVLELRLQPIKGRFDAEHLKAIHGHIFQDHPEFSPGQYREPRDFPHYVKNRKLEAGVTRHRVHYMPHNYAARVDQILADFGGVKGLQGLPLDQAADKLAKLYGDLDHAHPFVEGNSRTLRTFTQQLAKEAGYRLDWDTTTANPLTRDQLYIARDVAVTQRAFPGLDMQRAMDTENRAEYFAYVEVLSPHAKKPTLRDVIAVTRETRDMRILDSLNRLFDRAAYDVTPGAASDAALLELLCNVGSDSGELHAAVARALKDGRFSVAELQCVRTEALDLVSAVLAFVQRLEGLVDE